MASSSGTGCSNFIIRWINILTAILSIPIIAVGIYLAKNNGSECFTFLQKPVLVLGVFMLVISILGMFGSSRWGSFCLWLYLFFMGILILLLIAFTLFGFIVTSDTKGSTIAGYNFTVYRIGDYSDWLESQINGTESWRKIRSCMVESDYCEHLNTEFETLAQYQSATLSPTEAGCCRPPLDCGFSQTNFTTFEISPNASSLADVDCSRWSNNVTMACIDCDTCKGGVAHYIRDSWRTGSIILLVVVIFLMLLYCIGCCARFNADHPKFEPIRKKEVPMGKYERHQNDV